MSAQHTDRPAPAPKDDGLAWERCPELGPKCGGGDCVAWQQHPGYAVKPVAVEERACGVAVSSAPAPAAPAIPPELAERARRVGLEERHGPGCGWYLAEGEAIVYYNGPSSGGTYAPGQYWRWAEGPEVGANLHACPSLPAALLAAVEWLEARELEAAREEARARGLYKDNEGDWRYPNGFMAVYATVTAWAWFPTKATPAECAAPAPSEAAALRAVLAALPGADSGAPATAPAKEAEATHPGDCPTCDGFGNAGDTTPDCAACGGSGVAPSPLPPAASAPTAAPESPAPAEEPAAGRGGGATADALRLLATAGITDQDLVAAVREGLACWKLDQARLREADIAAEAHRQEAATAARELADANRELATRGELLRRVSAAAGDPAMMWSEAVARVEAATRTWPGLACPECAETEARAKQAQENQRAAEKEATRLGRIHVEVKEAIEAAGLDAERSLVDIVTGLLNERRTLLRERGLAATRNAPVRWVALWSDVEVLVRGEVLAALHEDGIEVYAADGRCLGTVRGRGEDEAEVTEWEKRAAETLAGVTGESAREAAK